MSRPLEPGLVAEGVSDVDFLVPVIDRFLNRLLTARSGTFVDLRPTLASECVKKHGKERFVEAARSLGQVCDLVFVHADHHERREAEALRELLACPTVVLVPKRETETWMLADPRAFRGIRGADVSLLPKVADLEREPAPKILLARVLRAAGVRRPTDYFEMLGDEIDLAALNRVPAFARWAAETERALKGLKYL
ncbi:DUF4276 family protein [Actinocorallia sp. A-T 12471]|uniref:DUF4276 family protein n=1 Tax=Actinocorallia sp. A-T 12471 TaxID=3089813 RepID=UPI0029D1CFE2|nr:DUF4276 family protein [Actinocorallia sp. A-T 12471]MDX6739009.1 DUF4276 family protein [Actinocorallia sp. A-T 12471]